MAKAENKTKATEVSVEEFLNSVDNQQKRDEAYKVLTWMKEATGHEPKMWGPSIVGFDTYHYKYESGREGDFLKIGFSPRKTALTLYIIPGFGRYDELMNKLGKYKTGSSCLYLKKLADINEEVLKSLIRESYEYMTKTYG